MEIRFSEGYVSPGGRPTLATKETVENVAAKLGLVAWDARARRESVRFVLNNNNGSMASDAAHDRVIRALLTLDPDATIRTARAVFEGLKDFEAQYAARVK